MSQNSPLNNSFDITIRTSDSFEQISESSNKRRKKNRDYISCKFFIPHKRRNCNARPHDGSEYCANHLIVVAGEKRIPCPLDPTHTIYEKKLQKHLKKCEARQPKSTESYFVEGINEGSGTDEETALEELMTLKPEEADVRISKNGFIPLDPLKVNDRSGKPTFISKYSKDKLLDIIKQVEQGLSKYELIINPSLQLPSEAQEELDSMVSVGPTKKKHFIQHASLMEYMKHINVFNNDHFFLEFGSGRGTLSHIIQAKLKSNHIIIDKAKFRHKAERLGRPDDKIFKRIVLDIKDLSITNIQPLKSSQPVVSFSKHLCGCATDLTLRSIVGCNDPRIHLDDIIIALCCHHKCTWKSFVGKDLFKKLGFDKETFNIIKYMSSWALSGKEGAASNLGEGLTAKNKKEWGIKCKSILEASKTCTLCRYKFK